MFGANVDMVGSALVAVPRDAAGIEGRHDGCAPFWDDNVPSVATSRDADFQMVMSSARRVVRSLCPASVIQTHCLHGRWIGAARANV